MTSDQPQELPENEMAKSDLPEGERSATGKFDGSTRSDEPGDIEDIGTEKTFIEEEADSIRDFFGDADFAVLDIDHSVDAKSDPTIHSHAKEASTKPPTKQAKAVRIKSIGRYKVESILGQGAYGRVYKATDTQLHRQVAVKVSKMTPQSGSVDRFLREARAAAQLRHPAIIPVYEYGQVEDLSMIVYQLIEGQTLREKIHRQQTIRLYETVELLRKIADGLDYAHKQGIVHRDIKPENILLDENGEPHIADFGCARQFDDQELNATLDGSILGTPSYMSPEQASGRANQADGRTDVWSLGIMLYEMVSGKRPFEGTFMVLLDSIQNIDPVPLRKLNSSIPRDIETICHRCLQRDINQRFGSAGELADELRRVENGVPIKSRRINSITRAWLWAKRKPVVASSLSLVFATLLLATMISTLFWNQAMQQQNQRAKESLNSLKTANSSELPQILGNLTWSPVSIRNQIQHQLTANPSTKRKRRLLVGLNFLSNDLSESNYHEIGEIIYDSDPYEIIAFAKGLSDSDRIRLASDTWAKVKKQGALTNRQRITAICLLAQIDLNSENWTTTKLTREAAGYLTAINLVEIKSWLDAIAPIKKFADFKNAVTEYFHDPQPTINESAACILASIYQNQPLEIVFKLLPSATPRQLQHFIPALNNKDNRSNSLKLINKKMSDPKTEFIEKANLIVALIQLTENEEAAQATWHGLLTTGQRHQNNVDNSVGTEVIERLGPSGTNVDILIEQIRLLAAQGFWNIEEKNNALATLILSLDNFNQSDLPQSKQEQYWNDLFKKLFENHPDSRVHCSIRWLYRNWGWEKQMDAIERRLASPVPDPLKNWHVDSSKNTFVIFEPGPQFTPGQAWKSTAGHRFGICITEVTSNQFIEFAKSSKAINQVYPPNQTPVVNVQYFWSLAYCHWLTLQFSGEKDSVFKVEQLRQNAIDLATDLFKKRQQGKLDNSWFKLTNTGYRLPTVAEWQFACRAGTITKRSFGRSENQLGQYAWYTSNSNDKVHPVATRKPNENGLFDMLGNVNEWCLDEQVDSDGRPTSQRYACGGHFHAFSRDVTTDNLIPYLGTNIDTNRGFRLARTYPPKKTSPNAK